MSDDGGIFSEEAIKAATLDPDTVLGVPDGNGGVLFVRLSEVASLRQRLSEAEGLLKDKATGERCVNWRPGLVATVGYCNANPCWFCRYRRLSPAPSPSAGPAVRPAREVAHCIEVCNVPKWQCRGCRGVFFGAHKTFCPTCGREGYWTGSVDPKAIEATGGIPHSTVCDRLTAAIEADRASRTALHSPAQSGGEAHPTTVGAHTLRKEVRDIIAGHGAGYTHDIDKRTAEAMNTFEKWLQRLAQQSKESSEPGEAARSIGNFEADAADCPECGVKRYDGSNSGEIVHRDNCPARPFLARLATPQKGEEP